ncbi:hypothetical protein QL285_016893 [Trifolium repens]|nr:hypothetical protein QL285_016893 [Trifolium repens]
MIPQLRTSKLSLVRWKSKWLICKESGSRNHPSRTPPNSIEHENFIRSDENIGVIEEFAEENVVENEDEEGLGECGTMQILKITKPHVTVYTDFW